MDRRAVFAVVGALCAVLLAAVATSGTVRFAERGPQISFEPAPTTPPEVVAPPTVPERSEEEPRDESPAELPAWVPAVLLILAAGLLVALLIWAWNNRPDVTWRRRGARSDDDFDVLAEVAASVAADADAQRLALLSGEPRNAIVECWLRLEGLIVGAGIPRRPSDTSEELVERVLAGSSVDSSAISDLSALYREARFSSHAMGEDARAAAIVALDSVHAELRSRAEVDGSPVDVS